MRSVFVAVALIGSAAAIAWGVTELPFLEKDARGSYVGWATICWSLFVLAVLLLRRVRASHVTALVLGGTVLLCGAGLANGQPNTSTDSARYAWDGIVQTQGVSPYQYVPSDPTLAHLRPDWLFPEPEVRADGGIRCDDGYRQLARGTDLGTEDRFCTAINRADVPTIYPPTSELYFWAVRAVVGPDVQYLPLMVLGGLLVVGTTAGILRVLRRLGRDPRWAALWGWCPLVVAEGVTNAHVDLVGAVLVVVATVLVAHRRRWAGGIALGAAIASKLIPVIAAPALLRRQPWKVVVGAVVTFAVLYVPYVVMTGVGVLGYLPGYLTEEGYEDGSRFALASGWLPDSLSTPLVALVLAVTALLVWRRTDPDAPWLGQLVMIGVTLLAVSPRYPWYALLLVPFVALTGRAEWLAIPVALYVRQFEPGIALQRSSLACAALVILLVSLWRWLEARNGEGWLLAPWRRRAVPGDAVAPPVRGAAA